MASNRLTDPQTLNLYSHTANDAVNLVDPDGKFWGWLGAIFGFLGAFFRNSNFSFNLNIRGLPLSGLKISKALLQSELDIVAA